MRTQAGEAEFELSRPRARFAQPLILAAVFSTYPLLLAFVLSPIAGMATLFSIAALAITFAERRRLRELKECASRVLNSAFNLIGLGRLREASEVLDVVEARVPEPWCIRIAQIQRAIIATRRGDMRAAALALDTAIEQPVGSYARDNAEYQLEGAHALRAFVRASLGDAAGARADIDDVRRRAASDDALARVALAEAILLEQAGKREDLRQLLAERGALLLEHTHPRERAIVRAFQRMVRSDKASVYRRAEARRESEGSEEPTLADWVAKVAPGAASFVRSTRAAAQTATLQPEAAVAAPTLHAIRANQEAKKPAERHVVRWIVGAVVGATAAIGAAAMFAYRSAPTLPDAALARPEQTEGVFFYLLLPILAMPVIYGVARLVQWIGRRRAEAEARSPRNAASGPPTDAQLQALSDSPSPVVGAQAWLIRADRAERAGDFAEALRCATAGLKRLAHPADRMAADIVYPDLLSMRAFCLAAVGRPEESNAELANLGPAYPHYGRAVFRAGLVAYLRRGDLEGAAVWIDRGEADLPLSVREELLADLVRAAVHPEQAGAGEVQRLKDELAASPAMEAWIRALAPELLDTFRRATVADVQLRIDSASDFGPQAFGAAKDVSISTLDPDREAEEEAQASLEADMARGLAR